MTFSEPWSKNLKIDKSTFRPIDDLLTDFGDDEDHDNETADLTDPNTRPDISIYEPISFEEIIQDPADHYEDIDWDSINSQIIESCKIKISIWESVVKENFEHTPVMSDEFNVHILSLAREATIWRFSWYKDIVKFGAWIIQANDELDELKRDFEKISLSFLKKTKASLEKKIQDLENEIEEFEDDWKIPEKIYECEELLLQTYVKEVVKAQKRIVKYRKSISALGRFGSKPDSREIKNSYDFEHYCRDWMEYLGGSNAVVSSATQDGGVDIISDGHVAQVKLYNGAVPVSQIRDLLGTSVDFGKKPIFFASMAYSKGSIEFADRNNIPLIVVDAYNGVLRGANHFGTTLIGAGIPHQD